MYVKKNEALALQKALRQWCAAVDMGDIDASYRDFKMMELLVERCEEDPTGGENEQAE